jgi:hypothetical protein
VFILLVSLGRVEGSRDLARLSSGCHLWAGGYAYKRHCVGAVCRAHTALSGCSAGMCAGPIFLYLRRWLTQPARLRSQVRESFALLEARVAADTAAAREEEARKKREREERARAAREERERERAAAAAAAAAAADKAAGAVVASTHVPTHCGTGSLTPAAAGLVIGKDGAAKGTSPPLPRGARELPVGGKLGSAWRSSNGGAQATQKEAMLSEQVQGHAPHHVIDLTAADTTSNAIAAHRGCGDGGGAAGNTLAAPAGAAVCVASAHAADATGVSGSAHWQPIDRGVVSSSGNSQHIHGAGGLDTGYKGASGAPETEPAQLPGEPLAARGKEEAARSTYDVRSLPTLAPSTCVGGAGRSRPPTPPLPLGSSSSALQASLSQAGVAVSSGHTSRGGSRRPSNEGGGGSASIVQRLSMGGRSHNRVMPLGSSGAQHP